MRKHLLAIAVILTGATGCDNVAWGGIDMELRPPPVSETAALEAADSAAGASVEKVPGPILLAGERDGERATFVVVGELLEDGLSEFPDPSFPDDTLRLAEIAAPGSEWILFSEGVRVGRLAADASRPAEAFCGRRVEISGLVELVPSAASAVRLLALPAADASEYPYEGYEQHEHDYDQRVASLSIGGEAISRYEAQWPANGILDIRDDIQAFRLNDAAQPWIAATFVHQDELTVASPGQGAYALFMVGRPAGGTDYEEVYSWYRSVETEGKGAPRYHDHLDWDGDGMDEILLDVFGSNRRWFAALDRRDGAWVRAFQDTCGAGSANAS